MEANYNNALIEDSAEFFTVQTNGEPRPLCIFSGKTYEFDHIPAAKKAIVYKAMKSMPVVEKAMEFMAGPNDSSKLKQFIMCRYGALNNEPDIDAEGVLSEPEYVPCSKRGTCKYEGVGCCAIKVSDNTVLSRSETEVFKLVRLPDKLIAAELFLSVETIKKHFQNIRLKTGFNSKIEMAIWATQKGII